MTAFPDRPLRVLFLSAEAEPLVKVGGLGDYSGSLPKAMKQFKESGQGRAIDVRVALPYHKSMLIEEKRLKRIGKIKVPKENGYASGSVFQYDHDGITYYLIDRSGRAAGYDHVYNSSSLLDARKYVFFSLASLEFIRLIDWKPDVIHANDWHSAVALYALSQLKTRDPYYQSIRSLLVIHNLPFMGEGSQKVLRGYGIQPVRSDLLPNWAKILPLPMGMQAADQIAAVSPGYAAELKEVQFGDGLVQFIRSRKDLKGILNGIDTSTWNPESDSQINQEYSFSSLHLKIKNKEALLDRFNLPYDIKIPLLFFISRLDVQKGVELMIQCLEKLSSENFQAIILGTGSKDLESALRNLEGKFPNKIRAVLKFDPALAHRLYAAGDILLMPSRYEPCGLSQMIAMRYGSIPVAHAVGGLKDSITSDPEERKTGYLFHKFSVDAFAHALKKAITDYSHPEKWQTMQARGMRQDFSWDHSAREYARVYAGLVNNKQEQR